MVIIALVSATGPMVIASIYFMFILIFYFKLFILYWSIVS